MWATAHIFLNVGFGLWKLRCVKSSFEPGYSSGEEEREEEEREEEERKEEEESEEEEEEEAESRVIKVVISRKTNKYKDKLSRTSSGMWSTSKAVYTPKAVWATQDRRR